MRPILLGAALCLGAVPNVVRADVFEIGANGAMAVPPNGAGMIDVADSNVTNKPAPTEPAPELPAVALTTIEPPVIPAVFRASLTQAAEAAQLSPSLLAALVWQESRWRVAALSPKGARGLTQLMPATARSLAVDPANVEANLAGGARYLRAMLDMFNGNVERALAAYNAGPRRVLRSTGLPAIAETRAYVASIIDRVGGAGPSDPAGD